MKEIQPLVETIKAAYPEIAKLDNDALRAKTKEIQSTIQGAAQEEKVKIAKRLGVHRHTLSAFIKENNLPNTKILLDTFHMNIEDADMEKSILDCGDLIGYIHVADSNRHYAGAGHIDLKQIINSLSKVDYSGFISAECLPLPNSSTALEGWIQGVKNSYKL